MRFRTCAIALASRRVCLWSELMSARKLDAIETSVNESKDA
jgi:hypothetical protein